MSKDRILAIVNRTTVEWDRKTRELKRKKMLQKQQAREQGEETGSDDDNDEEEFDEVVTDVEWDVLEGEDSLIGTHSSTQGPFPFHAGGSESVRPAEMGQTIGPSSGPVGVGGSAAAPGCWRRGAAPLPKDRLVVMVNRTVAEWDRKTKELKRKKMLQKQQAWERGEETDSDDDDDEEYDEVVVDVEWDVLEGEDSLTGTHSST